MDVVVVGAGLAGLRCAARLEDAGLEVTVLEAGDAPGGRVRSDLIDSFTCDRGFQLLNPAYPAVRRWVDTGALRLQRFGAGVAVRRDRGLVVVGDPRREPRLIRESLASGLLSPRELLALARWAGPSVVRPRSALRRPDHALAESLDAAGVTGPLRREVLDTFLAGVLADSSGRTSAAFVLLLLSAFARGTPGLPVGGMQALPDQLAGRLRQPVQYGARVQAVREEAGGVLVHTDGGTVRAGAAVVAVGPGDVGELVPGAAPRTSGLVTWWWSTPDAPYGRPLLTLDGRRGPADRPAGPVQHAAVVSLAAPSYAPPGRHLVEATVLPDRAPDASETDVRHHLSALWGVGTDHWELLVRHEIPAALPFQAVPLRTRSEPRVGARTYLAGDHRDTASLQGALVSGNRVAESVLADLAGG